jgi:hypothetical protein
MREQRKPNRQHPYTDYREREKTKHSAPDDATPVGTRNHIARFPRRRFRLRPTKRGT